MHEIPVASVAQFRTDHDSRRNYPYAIDTICPQCGRAHVTLLTSEPAYDGHRSTMMATASCPACRQPSHIWYVDEISLFIRPSPPIISREPIEGYELLPERIQRAYRAALDVYNAKVWTASAVSCRRTLEGIVNELHAEGEGTLAKQLRELPDKVDLAEPLITLSQAVREGGNLGAHFDQEKEPDRETADAMLDLIEYLLEYVYTLPRMIEDLKQKLDTLGQEDDAQES